MKSERLLKVLNWTLHRSWAMRKIGPACLSKMAEICQLLSESVQREPCSLGRALLLIICTFISCSSKQEKMSDYDSVPYRCVEMRKKEVQPFFAEKFENFKNFQQT